MINQKPKQIKSRCKTFLLPTEDICVHIIKTGDAWCERYIVVLETAYDDISVDPEYILTRQEIKERFKIDINE